MDVLTLLFGLSVGFSLGMLFVQIFAVHRLDRDKNDLVKEIIKMRKQGFVSYPDLEPIPPDDYPFVRED